MSAKVVMFAVCSPLLGTDYGHEGVALIHGFAGNLHGLADAEELRVFRRI
jgi:hypothetical protein